MWTIAGWIAWGVVALLALGWAYGCRNLSATGQSVAWGTAVLTLFWWIIAIVFIATPLNKLHIIWLTPVAFALSFLVAPPMGIPMISPIVLLVTRIFLAVITLGVEKHDAPGGGPEF
jgi:hypothetical protein